MINLETGSGLDNLCPIHHQHNNLNTCFCDRSRQLWGRRSRGAEFGRGPVPPGQRGRFRPGHRPHHECYQWPHIPGEHTVGYCSAGGWKHGYPGKEWLLSSTVCSRNHAEEGRCEVLGDNEVQLSHAYSAIKAFSSDWHEQNLNK